MKTLYINGSGYVGVDTEENTTFSINAAREAISRIFLLEENMHIVYDRGEKHYEMDGKKGDILVTFYENSFSKPAVLVKSKDWVSNLKNWEKEQQKQKEEWAAKKLAEACPTCDNCKSEA